MGTVESVVINLNLCAILSHIINKFSSPSQDTNLSSLPCELKVIKQWSIRSLCSYELADLFNYKSYSNQILPIVL